MEETKMELNLQKLKKRIMELDSNQICDFLLNLHPFVLGVWIFINIAIPVITLFYYFWQFEFYHPIFWIFIPDSYSFAILFGIFLLVTLGLKKNIQVLNIITFIGLVKVFWGYICVFSCIPSFFDLVSLTAHTLELIEGVLILPFLKTDLKNYSAAGSFLTLDWFFDFFNPFGLPTLGLYPYHEIYNPQNTEPFLLEFFLVFTFITFFLLIFVRLKYWTEKNTAIKWIEAISSINKNRKT